MSKFSLQQKTARLIVLQRIELINPLLKKLRKLLGRYVFSNFITKYFIDPNIIGKSYYEVMNKEFMTIKDFIEPKDKFFLSIGGGMGGLEIIINKNFNNKFFSFIEKNYVSKKVKYGWDNKNTEAYNDLNLQKVFLEDNGIDSAKLNIFDFDKDILPDNKFDVVISLLSLDYHYDFNIYKNYLKKISHQNTKIIFDTIRGDYFLNIFKNVKVLKNQDKTMHKSKRILCSQFLN